METIVQDVRYTLRSLRRRPGFTLAAVATLALGIGANTTIFSLVDALLLRAPAYLAEPERVVALYTSDFSGPTYGTSSYPDYYDLRAERSAFSGVAAFETAAVGVGEGSALDQFTAGVVSANYFEVVGVQPARGRFFDATEEAAPGDVVVLAHALWQSRYGGDPSIVGGIVRVNAQPFTVIGIGPAGFAGFDRSDAVDLWIPTRTAVRAGLNVGGLDQRTSRGIAMVARLAPGVSVAQAQERMDDFAQRMQAADSAAWTDVRGAIRRLTVVPERLNRVPPADRAAVLGLAGVLFATVVVVLLACCANIAGLLLAHAAGRAREVGVRIAIGAGRARIVRQLVTESLVLALLGGIVGTALAAWATSLLSDWQQRGNPLGMPIDGRIDLRVLAFTAILATVTGIIFGMVPALRARRVDVSRALKAEASGLTGRSGRLTLRGALVGAQVSLSLLLLIVALLLVRTLGNAYAVDPGFRTHDALLIGLAPLPGIDQPDPAATALAFQERLAALPGVTAVSWGGSRPLTGGGSRRGVRIDGYDPAPGEDMEVHLNRVGPGYFETLEIPIVAGRSFSERDRAGAPPVAIVNQAFVERYAGGRDPIGLTISMGARGELAVVGVARDLRFLSLNAPARPYFWVPALQEMDRTLFHVNTTAPQAGIADAVARIVTETAPGWTITSTRTIEGQLRGSLFQQRVAGWTLGLFAAIALLLAAVGLYGIVAYSVAQRTREVGIRLALGARPSEVHTLFVRQAAPIVAGGAIIGLGAAWASTRLIGDLLIGVATTDTFAFLAAPLLLAVVALFAAWIPARRAARIAPLRALRAD